jgi:hypothetical protein
VSVRIPSDQINTEWKLRIREEKKSRELVRAMVDKKRRDLLQKAFAAKCKEIQIELEKPEEEKKEKKE